MRVEYPEFARFPQFAGLFVGGCVARGEGSRFRAKAHAHTGAGPWRGWICVLSAKRLRNKSGDVSLLMWHELAHLVSGQGHTAKFERVMRELCGRSDVSKYRRNRERRTLTNAVVSVPSIAVAKRIARRVESPITVVINGAEVFRVWQGGAVEPRQDVVRLEDRRWLYKQSGLRVNEVRRVR